MYTQHLVHSNFQLTQLHQLSTQHLIIMNCSLTAYLTIKCLQPQGNVVIHRYVESSSYAWRIDQLSCFCCYLNKNNLILRNWAHWLNPVYQVYFRPICSKEAAMIGPLLFHSTLPYSVFLSCSILAQGRMHYNNNKVQCLRRHKLTLNVICVVKRFTPRAYYIVRLSQGLLEGGSSVGNLTRNTQSTRIMRPFINVIGLVNILKCHNSL